MIKKLSIAFALSGSLLLSSCDSYLDIQPIGQVIPNTLAEYRALLTTAYSYKYSDKAYTGMRTDEVIIGGDSNDKSSYADIERWNDASPSAATRTFGWDYYYKTIYYANILIDKRNEITEGSQEEIDQLVGEAYLLRGYTHFLLVNLYGKPYTQVGSPESKAIPLKQNVDLEETPTRNTVQEIYTAVLADIQTARKLIHQEEWESKYLYRFSTLSVDAMESRVRLYMGEWQEAYDAAERVLTKKMTLENLNEPSAKLPNNYLSAEMITAYESIYNRDIKASLVTASFLQKYGNGDLRPSRYFDAANENGHRPCIKGGSSEFNCTFRTGELYLNAAEAAAHLNKLTEARTRLLQLMEKRLTPEGYTQKKNEVNAMNQTNLMAEILEERARELAFEGHRWFDLRRTTRPRIEKVLDEKTFVLEQEDPRYTLRIPQAAIDANPGLLN